MTIMTTHNQTPGLGAAIWRAADYENGAVIDASGTLDAMAKTRVQKMVRI